ncbi:MAG: hypothetical protein ACI97A_004025, partial [Planctomycetota bacterium]
MVDAHQKLVQRPSGPVLLGIVFLVVVALMGRFNLTTHLPSNWMPDWSDDFVFVAQAQQIGEGHWLGDYNFRQLKNPPGLPLTLSATSRMSISEHGLSFILLSVSAVGILLALIRLGISIPLAGFTFLSILFNPALFGAVSTRLTPERLYVLQYLCCIGLVLGLIGAQSRRLFWGLGILLVSTAAWAAITSEDAPGLWPLLLLGLIGRIIIQSPFEPWKRSSLTTSLPLLLLIVVSSWTAIGWVKNKNLDHYGVAVITEAKESNYLSALGAIRRVARHEPNELGALTTAQRQSLYGVSPRMKTLRAVLESEIYSGPSKEVEQDPTALGRPASLFRLALREAAAQAGFHHSASAASQFFGNLAREINEACDQGKVPATKEHFQDDTPIAKFSGFGQAIHRLWYRIHELWRFEYEDMKTADALAAVAVNQNEVSVYEKVLLSKPAAMAPHPYIDADRRAQVRGFYQWLFPALFFAAVIALFTQTALLKERGLDRFLVLETLFFCCCVYHAFVVSWQEIFWLADQGRSLFPGYFVLVIWASISLGAYGRFGKSKATTEQNRKRSFLATWAMGILLLVSMLYVQAQAEQVKSPILEQNGMAFESFFVFQKDAELDAITDGIRVRFPTIASEVDFRWKRMKFSDAQNLVIEADLGPECSDGSFEISWTGSRVDDLGGKTRQLFAKNTGPNRWFVPL